MMFILLGLTVLVIGGIAYLILKKSNAIDTVTCILCGENLADIYSVGAYAYDTKALIEKEQKCVKCGGEMELKTQ